MIFMARFRGSCLCGRKAWLGDRARGDLQFVSVGRLSVARPWRSPAFYAVPFCQRSRSWALEELRVGGGERGLDVRPAELVPAEGGAFYDAAAGEDGAHRARPAHQIAKAR